MLRKASLRSGFSSGIGTRPNFSCRSLLRCAATMSANEWPSVMVSGRTDEHEALRQGRARTCEVGERVGDGLVVWNEKAGEGQTRLRSRAGRRD